MHVSTTGSPAQRLRDHLDETRQRVRRFGGQPFGLARSWAGSRYLASCHETSHGFASVELAHGQHIGHGPLLLVDTVRAAGSGDVVHPWDDEAPADLAEVPLQLFLDGAPTPARSWRYADRQFARAGHGPFTVIVRARAWAELYGLALVRVDDIESYLRGREILLYRRRR